MRKLLMTLVALLLTTVSTLASNNETLSDNTPSDGVYLVSVDRFGNEQWVEMIPSIVCSYQIFYDFFVDLSGSRAHFYFWAFGKKYGAPAKDTPLVLGIATENQVVPYDPASGNELYYYTSDAGYSYLLELILRYDDDYELTGFYLSSARGGTVGLQTELGDVDLDHRVTISDVTTLIDYLLDNNLSYYVDKYNADVDQDGAINISDVTALIDRLLGYEQPNEHYETPAPEVTVVTDTNAEVVTINATGEGSVVIYVNYFDGNGPQAVAAGYGQATFEIPFGDEVIYVGVWATAQADEDALVGESETEYVEVPAKEDPHMTGYWLVMVLDDGTKDYVQLIRMPNGDYINTYALYPMYLDIARFYFVINGIPYYAAEDAIYNVDGAEETEAFIGDYSFNPLTTEGNKVYYVYVYINCGYAFGIHIEYDNETTNVSYSAYVSRSIAASRQ